MLLWVFFILFSNDEPYSLTLFHVINYKFYIVICVKFMSFYSFIQINSSSRSLFISLVPQPSSSPTTSSTSSPTTSTTTAVKLRLQIENENEALKIDISSMEGREVGDGWRRCKWTKNWERRERIASESRAGLFTRSRWWLDGIADKKLRKGKSDFRQ